MGLHAPAGCDRRSPFLRHHPVARTGATRRPLRYPRADRPRLRSHLGQRGRREGPGDVGGTSRDVACRADRGRGSRRRPGNRVDAVRPHCHGLRLPHLRALSLGCSALRRITLSLRENHMEDIRILVIWLNARLVERERDERGFTAVEWLLIALGVIVIAGIAVAAIKAYVTAQTNKLGTP